MVYSRIAEQPLFSAVPNRKLNDDEIDRGVSRMGELLNTRAPVLRAEFDRQAEILAGLAGIDRTVLVSTAVEERENTLDVIDRMCQEVLEVAFQALAFTQPVPPYDARCPFLGLYSFRMADAEFFFGREPLVDRLVSRLDDGNFLAVVGPSGCGKSSLVLAGMLPKLQVGRVTFRHEYMTPGEDPLDTLDRILDREPLPDLVIVDQFEELFTLCTKIDVRQQFADRLVELARARLVIITMRADFWGECTQLPDLKVLIQECRELVDPMTPAEMRTAIDKQAQKVRLQFEADLSATIVNKVAGEPGGMPLLQYALQELWKRRRGRWLTTKKSGTGTKVEYEDADWVLRAIGDTARDVYRNLASDGSRERARGICVRLVRLGDDSNGHDVRRDTRQPVKLSDLTPVGDDPEDTKRLVKLLADEGARLLVISDQPQSRKQAESPDASTEPAKEVVVELAHEALIWHWPQLQRWLEEDRSDLRLLASVREAAAEWATSQTDPDESLIHRGSRLKEALRLYSHPRLKPNQSEANYLTACVRLAKRNQRRMIIGLSALVILAAVAWWKWRAVNDLVAKNAEIASNLDHANENRQTTLAKSLLRPIGITAPKISPAERSAYNELVALPADQERVRFQFIALALSDPPSAERFWRSAPVPIHAAVQFDVERRRKVLQETNLSDRLQDQSTPLSVRKACVAIGVELSAHLLHEAFAELAAATLCEAVGTDDAADLARVQQYLLWSTDKHRPEAASRSLLAALTATTRYDGIAYGARPSEDGKVSEADQLDVLLGFVDTLPARLSASDLETAVSLLWKADSRPQSPQQQAPIRPNVNAFPAFPRRARTLEILLSKAHPDNSQAILSRLVAGTAPRVGGPSSSSTRACCSTRRGSFGQRTPRNS